MDNVYTADFYNVATKASSFRESLQILGDSFGINASTKEDLERMKMKSASARECLLHFGQKRGFLCGTVGQYTSMLVY